MSSFDGHHQYRPDIDGMRAIAVISVLMFHAYPLLLPAGFIGVDIFFVISGFLITEIIYGHLFLKNFSFLVFLFRRIRRLFPALTIVLLVTFTLALVMLSKFDQVEIGKQIFAGIFFISNFYFRYLGDYFGPQSKDLALLNLWSLGVEEQFYLVWPLILVLIFYLKRKILLPVLICTGVCSFIFNVAGAEINSTAIFFGPFSRFWELILGGLSFFFASKLRNGSIPSAWPSILGLILITTGLIFIDSKVYSGWWALFPTMGTALFILSDTKALLNRIMSCKFLVNIGLISYPIYLWHLPILFFTKKYFTNPSNFEILSAIFVSIFASYLTYFYIEAPIRRLILWKGFVLSLVGIFVLCIYILYFWSILPEYKKNLIFTYDPQPHYRFGTCFLNSFNQGPEDFRKDCVEKIEDATESVLLWGDSMAAHLYPGLQSLQQKYHFNLIQRTASSCPPSALDNYKQIGNCNSINQATRKFIGTYKPQNVILAARFPNDELELELQISTLTKFLRAEKVQEIVISGPMPDWRPDIRSILLNSSYRANEVPDLMQPPLEFHKKVLQQDFLLAKVAKKYQISYISSLPYFCKSENLCKIYVSTNFPDGLITSDHDHLTEAASKYLWKELDKELMRGKLSFN